LKGRRKSRGRKKENNEVIQKEMLKEENII
jgi:hypothetical protein